MEPNDSTSKKSVLIAAIAIVTVLVIGVVVFVFVGHRGASSPATATNTDGQTQQPAGGSTATPAPASVPASTTYASSQDGFSISFPTTPEVANLTFNSPTAGSIPLTEYKEMSTGPAYYEVFVYHYPSTYQFASDYLTGALQTFVGTINASYPGSAITSQSPSQFLGQPGIFATVHVKVAGSNGDTDNHLLIATKGNNTYIVSTYGMSQYDFNLFVDSFAFTQ